MNCVNIRMHGATIKIVCAWFMIHILPEHKKIQLWKNGILGKIKYSLHSVSLKCSNSLVA